MQVVGGHVGGHLMGGGHMMQVVVGGHVVIDDWRLDGMQVCSSLYPLPMRGAGLLTCPSL